MLRQLKDFTFEHGYLLLMQKTHFIIFLLISSINGFSNSDSTETVHYLHPGSIEIGVGGSVLMIDGVSNASFSIRSAYFQNLGAKNLLGIGGEIGYSHIRSFNQIDVQGNLSFYNPFSGSSVYYFIMLGGGIRYEWLGSFRERLFPLGFNLGINALISQSAAFRFDYSFRRIFGDSVSNFNEHRFIVGISIFLQNN